MNKTDKKAILENILKSETFRNAPTMAVLFRFLAESSINSIEVNTCAIGIELFGKKYEPDLHDVNIRVNVSHLRKRLAKYYQGEGAADGWQIVIETGKYKASFKTKELPKKSTTKPIVIIVSLCTLLLFSCFYAFVIYKPHTLWSSMFENKYPTTLYLGDVFGYTGRIPTSERGWIRDATINSEEEFYKRKRNNPNSFASLEACEYSFVVFENACTIQPFTKYFTTQGYNFLIRPISEFSIRSLKTENTIYSGPMHVNPTMVEVFNNLSNRIKIRKDSIDKHARFFIENSKEHTKALHFNSGSKTGEYALVASFKGPNKTRHYQFFSNHGMGLTSIVDYFTNPVTLNEFSENNALESDEFIALFFVKGKKRTNLSMELIFVEENAPTIKQTD